MDKQHVIEGASSLPPLPVPVASVKEKLIAGGVPTAIIEVICMSHGGISVPSLLIGGFVGYIGWKGYPLFVKEYVDRFRDVLHEAEEEKRRQKQMIKAGQASVQTEESQPKSPVVPVQERELEEVQDYREPDNYDDEEEDEEEQEEPVKTVQGPAIRRADPVFVDFHGGEVALPAQLKRRKQGDIFRFSELLDQGFLPSLDRIFLGRTLDGRDIFVKAEDLCHVAIAGRTGGGKGSIMRLIMVQLAYIGAQMLLLNPHYMQWVSAKDGEAFDEDWTPFEGVNPRTGKPYLKVAPLDCSEIVQIEHYLTWVVMTELQRRIRVSRTSKRRHVPFFIILDEWPSIVEEFHADKTKSAPKFLSKLLREGRKFGIFVVVASQDFQVKTMGLEAGSVRKCLQTILYTGGDPTTAKELLNDTEIPENRLGKGTIGIRCVGTENISVLAETPFVDNPAVYRLLGPSTFVSDETEDNGIELDLTNLETMSYEQMVKYAHQTLKPNGRTDPDDDNAVVTAPPTKAHPSNSRPVARKQTLSPELQAALDVHDRGLSLRDAARELDVSKDTVSRRYEKLKKMRLI